MEAFCFVCVGCFYTIFAGKKGKNKPYYTSIYSFTSCSCIIFLLKTKNFCVYVHKNCLCIVNYEFDYDFKKDKAMSGVNYQR